MGLPTIAPYPMPRTDELPRNKVDWAPDPSRAALLVHDLQNYFVDAYQPDTSPVSELLGTVGRLVGTARQAGVPVLYSAQPGSQAPKDRALLTDFWGPGMADDGYGPEIVDGLAPAEQDVVLTKWRYSAFVRTDLDERLRRAGRDQLFVCGIYAHIGVLATAQDAFMRDVRPFLVADAVADFTEQRHWQALETAAGTCAVVLGADRAVDALAGAA